MINKRRSQKEVEGVDQKRKDAELGEQGRGWVWGNETQNENIAVFESYEFSKSVFTVINYCLLKT
jgi:hypothetical protein